MKWEKAIFALLSLLALFASANILTAALFSFAVDLQSCAGKDHIARAHCWQDLIEASLTKNGIEGAFRTLSAIYAGEPDFALECHGYTHKIGEAAYLKFASGNDFALTPKTAYCGYGFFHGFMETLLASGADIAEARRFCSYVNKKLSGQIKDALNHCYHGIGHGFVDGADKISWGDAELLIKPGLELCERVGETGTARDRCASGVFNALAVAYTNSDFGLKLDMKNPYGICGKQGEPYSQKTCYEEMNTAVLNASNKRFDKAAKLAEAIPEDEYASFAIQGLAVFASSFLEDRGSRSYQKIVGSCLSLREELRIPCFLGFAAGLVEFGPPQSEYKDALGFCRYPPLADRERELCFWRVLASAKVIYSKEKFKNICRGVEEPYQKYCKSK